MFAPPYLLPGFPNAKPVKSKKTIEETSTQVKSSTDEERFYVLSVYDKNDDGYPLSQTQIHKTEKELQEILGIDEELYCCYSIPNQDAMNLLHDEGIEKIITDDQECDLEVYSDLTGFENFTS